MRFSYSAKVSILLYENLSIHLYRKMSIQSYLLQMTTSATFQLMLSAFLDLTQKRFQLNFLLSITLTEFVFCSYSHNIWMLNLPPYALQRNICQSFFTAAVIQIYGFDDFFIRIVKCAESIGVCHRHDVFVYGSFVQRASDTERQFAI